jgi:hypothetical protein
MSLAVIRPFTADDDAALTASAMRFAERHCLNLDIQDRPWEELQLKLWALPTTWSETTQLRRLWQACLCRALRVPVSAGITVAYGHVGYRVN